MDLKYHSDDLFKIEVTGAQMRLLIARQVGDLEEERMAARENYRQKAAPPAALLEEGKLVDYSPADWVEIGNQTDRQFRRSIASLTTIADLLKPDATYFLSLGDLAMLGIAGR